MSSALPKPVSRGPYRIHVVAELVGVPAATLRAWERRYGIPSPDRTATGYRLYGEREVELIRSMNELVQAGVAAQDAARQALAEHAPASSTAEGSSHPRADVFSEATARLIEAVQRFDEAALRDELRRVMYLGSAAQIVDRVLGPMLVRVGDLWEAGAVSIAQEHLATELAGSCARDLLHLVQDEDAESTVLCACFADEDHIVGLLTSAVRLASWGMRPILLGARTPPSAIRDTIQALRPDLVALSVTITPTRQRLRELVDDYASACTGVPWIVGGSAAPEIATAVEARGGLVAPDDATALRKLVQRVLRQQRSPRPATPNEEPEAPNKPAKRKKVS